MEFLEGNQRYLGFLKDIYEVSAACGTRTYIWGGFAIDVLEGRFLREHHDLDGFTRDLLDVRERMTALFCARGYEVAFREDFDMLTIARDGLHAAFNRLEVDGETAMWRHIGDEGTVYFPLRWLDDAPRAFYAAQVYLAGVAFEYTLKTNIRMLHAEWNPREKDRVALDYLESAMARNGLDPEEELRHVWSYNPFWAKRGHPEYAMPTVARPLRPLDACSG
ncbi:MAG: nucleotidyltransferase domain-containing protein [Anaerolineae bacterium]